MKRTLFLLLFNLTLIMGFSKVTKPDFAFPKTVSAEATADLQKANQLHDAHAAINALIRLTVAQNLIDGDSLQTNIRLVEETASKYTDSDIYGMFPALLACLYSDFYDKDRWVYDRRELPLTPYPSDISEWSGAQFKQKIIDLAMESLSQRYQPGLSSQNISDYKDIITIGYLTSTYFPSLYDFCRYNAVSKIRSFDSEKATSLISRFYEESNAESAQRVVWLYEKMKEEIPLFSIKFKKVKDELDNKYAGLLVASLSPSLNLFNLEKTKEYLDLARGYLSKYKSTPFADEIKNNIEKVLAPEIEIQVDKYCSLDHQFELKITNTNAHGAAINVYYAGMEKLSTRSDEALAAYLMKKKPMMVLPVKEEAELPFIYTDSISLTFDRPGYYYFLPTISKKPARHKSDYSVDFVRCIPVFPVAINSEFVSNVITVEPYTGASMEGIGIKAQNHYSRNNGKTIDCGVTNEYGIVDVFDKLNEGEQYKITAQVGDKSYEFEDIRINRENSYYPEKVYRSCILTDRALYHPGDSLNALVVVSEAKQDSDRKYRSNVLANKEVSITLFDANNQPVDTVVSLTDDWGRATASFKLPAEGLTGQFNLQASLLSTREARTYKRVMVSDYKMPDFEIKIDEVACDTPVKGAATVKATATAYSGMPMADTKVTLGLSECSWGWWRWYSNNSKIYSAEAVADSNGEVSFVIPDSVLTSRSNLYSVKLDAVSPVGTAADASTAFSLSKRYEISMTLYNKNVDGEVPFCPDIKVYAPDGSIADIPLKWTLKSDTTTIASAPLQGEIDLSDVTPGSYTFIVESEDSELAEYVSERITVYNVRSGIVPKDFVLWTANNKCEATSEGKAEVLIANHYDDTYIYYYVTANKEVDGPHLMKTAAGYHNLNVQLPDSVKRGTLYLYTVKHAKAYSKSLDLVRTEERGLKIIGESFRDRLTPSASEIWKIKIVDAKGQASQSALALDMYNKALDALMPHSFNLYFAAFNQESRISASYIRNYHSHGYLHLLPSNYYNKNGNLKYPSFNFYDVMIHAYGRGGIYDMEDGCVEMECRSEATVTSASAPKIRGIGKEEKMLVNSSASMEMEEAAVDTADADMGNAEGQTESFDYRDSDVPMAIWAPMLTTDSQGDICYTFTVPNANTTWRLKAVAWTKDTEAGSLMRDFVASKPVMVQPNLPRFLRAGDNAIIEASVMNNTDEEQSVTTTVEIFDPLTSKVIDSKKYRNVISPKGYEKVKIDLKAGFDINAIGYRVRSTNGQFSDGEQNVIRVLPSEQALIETTPFYLNPGDTSYSTTLPSQKGARLSLSFCENPAWTIVSALPGLRTQIDDYANSAGAALYSAAISTGIVGDNPKISEVIKAWIENPNDSALVSMLEKNEDLKIAVLTATPWVRAAQSQTQRMANLAMIFDENEVNSTIAAAIKILSDLQNPDGGWAWAKWCNESSEWATANVLGMLGDLQRLGWLPADKQLSKMIDRAVKYYDGKVEDTDILYCLIRPLFPSPVSSNGRKVINATLKEIRKDWKNYTDPADKAMAASALYLNGDAATAHELMRSISEFGVMTKDQGLKFPSVNALYNYAILLDAYAMIEPGSKEVDGLRQQLIVRKQANDWGDAVVTMEVVKAIITSGTAWTVDAQGAKVEAAGINIMPRSPMEKATGAFVADLSKYPGKKLTVTTTGVGPAYGAVYAQFTSQMNKVEASGCDDLDIEKQLFVRRGTQWEVADKLQVGDRVKVQLTIHTKRNMQYVEIIDLRPAAFEPVDQLPGWMWSEGVGFYKENRDAQTNLHVVYMTPGTYLLTYEMNVAQAGTFTSGVASIQSQYAPELSAHSSGCIIKVSE